MGITTGGCNLEAQHHDDLTIKFIMISDSLRARNPQIMANGQILTAQDMIEEEQHHQQQYQQQHQQVENH